MKTKTLLLVGLVTLFCNHRGFAQQSDFIHKIYPEEWIIHNGWGETFYDVNNDSVSEIITQQYELEHFDYGVKKSINISSSEEPVHIGGTDKVTFRATDFFEITGPFQVDSGGEMTVMVQECLQCSMEGVVLPTYGCGMDKENE